MEPIRKSVVLNDVQYTFRLPTAKDMIQMDLAALRLREGVSDGLSFAYPYSQSVAMLGQLCVDPKGASFEDLYPDDLDRMSAEVTEWINTFRKPVGNHQDPANPGPDA